MTHEFTFSTIFKIREPQYEEVLIDLKNHEDETTNRRRIEVNEEGFFSEPTYEHINSQEIDFGLFTLKSSFFKKNYAQYIKRKSDGNGDNSYKIYLDRSQSMELLSNLPFTNDQIIRVIPKTKGKIEVLQRHSNGLNINGVTARSVNNRLYLYGDAGAMGGGDLAGNEGDSSLTNAIVIASGTLDKESQDAIFTAFETMAKTDSGKEALSQAYSWIGVKKVDDSNPDWAVNKTYLDAVKAYNK